MSTCELEKNPSILLSRWREEIKGFCAAWDASAFESREWHASYAVLLDRFRAWDYLMVHQAAALRELFSMAGGLCSNPGVPQEIRESIFEFVSRKIRVITDLPENRDFAERFFEVRHLLPRENPFRRLFVSRFIEREAYASLLAPLHEVTEEVLVPHEQSLPYIFEEELQGRIRELARQYGES